MTQEEKELLLVALCGYLSHNIRVKIGDYSDYVIIGCNVKKGIVTVKITNDKARSKIDINCEYVKPYLRSMSSMTEEEQKEFVEFHCVTLCPIIIDTCLTIENEGNMLDWLNAHHFDWRGLIPMGLAIEVNDKNNPY